MPRKKRPVADPVVPVTKITRGGNRTAPDQDALRKLEVTRLRLAGYTTREIATMLHTSASTVSEDMKVLTREWMAEAQENRASAIGLDVARLDALIHAIWEKAVGGDLPAIREVVRLLERRAKVMGLDAPELHRIGGEDGGPVVTTTYDLRETVRAVALREGLDEDELMEEALSMLPPSQSRLVQNDAG